jgi:hypothetical protein
LGLVEVVIAVVLIIIVALPVTTIVIETQRAAQFQDLRAQAVDVATQWIENEQLVANNQGDQLAAGTGTKTYTLTGNTFTLTWHVNIQVGTSSTVCTAPAGSGQGEQIYVIDAEVAWRNMNGPVVSESAEVAPASAGAASSNAGEIAIPVFNLDSTLDTTDDVWFSLIGVWTGSGVPPVSAYTSTPPNRDTGTSGCAVFTGLDADVDSTNGGGWFYTASVVYCGGSVVTNCTNANIVDFDEEGASVAAQATPVLAGIPVTAGQIQVASPPFTMGTGSTLKLSATACAYVLAVCTNLGNPVLPTVSEVTVENTHLACQTGLGASVCTLGNPSAGTPSVVTSGTQNLTLFPYPDGYHIWSGDMPESNPGAASTSGVAYYPTGPPESSITTSASTTAASTIQCGASGVVTPAQLCYFYSAILVTNSLAGGHTFTGLSFTEVDGAGTTYQFSVATCLLACTVKVALPLGEYKVTVLGSSDVLYENAATTGSLYDWVTPTGSCYSLSSAAANVQIPTDPNKTADIEGTGGSCDSVAGNSPSSFTWMADTGLGIPVIVK